MQFTNVYTYIYEWRLWAAKVWRFCLSQTNQTMKAGDRWHPAHDCDSCKNDDVNELKFLSVE